MKKCLSILVSLVMVFSIMSVTVFATEANEEVGITATSDTQPTAEITSIEDTDDADTEAFEEEEQSFIKAKIVEVGDIKEQMLYGVYKVKMQDVKVQVLDGKYAGQEYKTTYLLTLDQSGIFEASPLKVGDKVYVEFEQIVGEGEHEGEITTNVYIIKQLRETNLFVAGILVVIVLLLIGAMNGVKTLGLIVANTAVAMIAIFALYFNGVNAILSLLVLVIPIIIIDILIMKGFNKESWVAILAVVVSTILTFGLLTLINECVSVVGTNEYASYLLGVNPELIVFNYLDILVAGTMLMTLGIAIDMGIRAVKKGSQGKGFLQTVKEVCKKLPNKLNTVFLVWLGGFVTIFTILMLLERPIVEIINIETVLIELIKVMAIFLNALIVIPVGVLLSKELLKIRGLVEPKTEDEDIEETKSEQE